MKPSEAFEAMCQFEAMQANVEILSIVDANATNVATAKINSDVSENNDVSKTLIILLGTGLSIYLVCLGYKWVKSKIELRDRDNV